MNNEKVFVNSHPIVQDRLTILRDKETPSHIFRKSLNDIALFLSIDATASLSVSDHDIDTPLQAMKSPRLVGDNPLIIPILRAGLALSEPMQQIIPHADTGHIGLYRDHETHLPVEYLNKLPSHLDRPMFVVDPMLATGHSMIKTIDILIEKGASVDNIIIVTLLCAPEGIELLQSKYSNIVIYTAAIDNCLNENAYITPGLGDAGDRYFGTV